MIISVADPGSPEVLSPEDFERAMFDRRSSHSPLVKNLKTGKLERYEPHLRAATDELAWEQVKGITLHQTACDMGELLERYDTIGAHFAVLRSSRVLRMCDETRVVWHGQGWNQQCVGIEINGLYAGREDDPTTAPNEAIRTTWDNPATARREQPMAIVPEQMAATRSLIRWIAWNVARHGGEVKVLCAHRQSSAARPNDPGEGIWRVVALPLHAELGLTDGGVGFAIDDGQPIPECWDPRCVGVPY